MRIDFYKGTNPVLHFQVQGLHAEHQLEFEVRNLIHGGRSTRTAAVQAQPTEDLESGLHKYPPLSAVAFLVPTFNATTSDHIFMYDNANSAEVEFVILTDNQGNQYVTVGSDHTDRDLERTAGPPKSKLVAPKVMAPVVWPYEEVKDHWDQIVMRAYVCRDGERVLYQEDTLATLLTPEALLETAKQQTGLNDLGGSALFGGSIAFLHPESLFGRGWDLELFDPILQRSLKHHFDVDVIWHRIPPYPTAARPPTY